MSASKEKTVKTLPMIVMRGQVAFPGQVFHFEASRKISVNAVNLALESDQILFLVTQKDLRIEDPKEEDMYDIGCTARVQQVLKVSPQNIKVVVEVLDRAKRGTSRRNPKLWLCNAEISQTVNVRQSRNYQEALTRKIRNEFERYVSMLPNPLSPEIVLNAACCDDPGKLSDLVAANIPAPVDDKQYVLEQVNPVSRAKTLLRLLQKECDLLLLDNKISDTVKQQIDENQREYYLREQIKAINSELYGSELDEDEEYFDKIASMNAPDGIKEKLTTELSKLLKMPLGSQEATVVRSYLDTCLELPWNKETRTTVSLKKATAILDRDFFGMQKVKERILETLSVYTLAPDIRGQVLCLVGPPGVGKTSIGKTIAECMGRRYARVSLGGISDEAEIRGHRRTYIGSMPGKILSAVKQAGSSDALILLDEIDKLGHDYKGDPASALLEVLDGEQNNAFTDHYLDLPYDLSKTVFIATANTLDTIPAPLLDRLEIIELSSYTREEKFHIAKKHLVSRQFTKNGISAKVCHIADSALYEMIDYYTREAGVRQLERTIGKVCRKVAKRIVEDNPGRITVKDKDIVSMLGHRKVHPEAVLKENEVGIINGLAWTSVGGEMMQIEASAVPGTGKVELTGSLGDVMKESAMAAVTYVRSRCETLGIEKNFYKHSDMHIHATEAAIPKDGPSAGITMTTALISALTNRPVRRDVAMTGEITIRGRVLPIGGLKEKTMAAYRNGIKTVIIPYENLPDLEDVDEAVRKELEFVPVHYEDEVIDRALL